MFFEGKTPLWLNNSELLTRNARNALDRGNSTKDLEASNSRVFSSSAEELTSNSIFENSLKEGVE